jgi:hypothetical protein
MPHERGHEWEGLRFIRRLHALMVAALILSATSVFCEHLSRASVILNPRLRAALLDA